MNRLRIDIFYFAIIICCFSFCLNATEQALPVAPALIQRLTPQQFDDYLKGVYEQGLTVKGQTPEVQAKIEERVKILDLLPKAKLTPAEISELKKFGISIALIKIIQEIGVDESKA